MSIYLRLIVFTIIAVRRCFSLLYLNVKERHYMSVEPL